MEIIKQYPYVAIGLLALVFFLALRSRGSAGSITQIGGGADVLALAQLESSERDADENRKFGLINSLIGYDMAKRTLASQDSLARIQLSQQLDLARLSGQNAVQLAALQGSFQQYNAQMQYELQRYQLQRQFNAQRRNDWLGLITTGIGSVMPFLTGGMVGFGGSAPRTPVFNPGY